MKFEIYTYLLGEMKIYSKGLNQNNQLIFLIPSLLFFYQ